MRFSNVPSPAVLVILFSATAAAIAIAHDLSKICNSFNPKCGLTPAEAQAKYLTTYEQLAVQLEKIKRASKVPISVGPLVQNRGQGLVNIDVPLDQTLSPAVNTAVCGDSMPTPTIRDAVVCTVTKDTSVRPPRGNVDPNHIGKSTQGRTLLGARLGNPEGTRVFVVTQLHGNEAASTEAALATLRELTRNSHFSKRILAKLDMLFLLRANPDSGEPYANNNPRIGVPYKENAGFFRQNVDPSAGGGFTAPTEPGFLGVVGRGYDPNRYNYADLRGPIRPVESQALVAVIHAFRPHVLFDLHGDVQKVLCKLNPDSLVPGGIGGWLPSVKCLPPAAEVPSLSTDRKSMVMGGLLANDASVLASNWTANRNSRRLLKRNRLLVRSIAAEVMKKLDPKVVGVFTRFSQIQAPGASTLKSGGKFGTLDTAALSLSGVGIGWEVLNFGTAMRPAVVGLSMSNGKPVPSTGLDTAFIEPCFMQDNICLHNRMLRQALRATVKFADNRLKGDNGFCKIPLNSGQVARLPSSLGFPPNSSVDEERMSPSGGQLGVPVLIAGKCPRDPSTTL